MQDGAVYKPASSDIPDHEQYFLIKCIQFSKTREATQADVTAGRAGAVGEEIANHLAHDSSNGWLALQVDVQWPYKFGPGNADDDGSGDDGSGDSKGTITAKANLREHFVYPAAITR